MEYTPPKSLGKVKDLTGKTFGKLTVLTLLGKRTNHASRCMWWLCICACGNLVELDSNNFTCGHTISCGCENQRLRKERATSHGLNRTPEHNAWIAMKQRCTPYYRFSERYADRGIKVCERWANSFEAFFADVGKRPSSKHSLDRIDNNGNYEPGNVRWATIAQQQNNRRCSVRIEFESESYAMPELCAKLGLHYKSFAHFYRSRKLSLEESINKARRV